MASSWPAKSRRTTCWHVSPSLRDLVDDLGIQFVRRVMSSKHFKRSQYRRTDVRVVDPNAVATFLKEARGLRTGLVEKLQTLADALADDEAARPATVLVLAGSARGIAAGHFRPLPIPDDVPVVLLDATADPLLVELALRRPVVVVEAHVDQTAKIFQTVGARYPASTLLDPSGFAVDRVMQIVEVYKKKNASHQIGIVIKKGVFESPPVRARILRTVGEDHVRFFWSLRGNNQMKDYDALFVIGASRRSPAVEQPRCATHRASSRGAREVVPQVRAVPSRSSPCPVLRGRRSRACRPSPRASRWRSGR